MNDDFLEHYGVLGMKWGVIRTPEELGHRDTQKQDDVFSRMTKSLTVTGYVSSSDLGAAYDIYDRRAQKYMQQALDKLNMKAFKTGNNEINNVVGERADQLWAESYKKAANDMKVSDENLPLLIAYAALVERGIADEYSIGYAKKDGKKVLVFRNIRDLKVLETVDAAYAHSQYLKVAKAPQRERNVANVAPVSIKKGNSITGGPVNSESATSSSLSAALQSATKKKKTNKIDHYAVSCSSSSFLEHYGVKGQKHGVRNGPPYPLKGKGKENFLKQAKKRISKALSKASKKKKKKAEKAKQESDDEIRQKVLKSVDPKYIYKHRALLDDKELQGRIDRINKETTLKKLAQPEDRAYKVAKKGDNWLRTTANMANSVKDIYTAMNVINSIAQKGVNKSESSTVNINVGGKKDKKKDKKDDNK